MGEHHRPEFSISAPETVLAGLATQTDRIHLASGVTVLSSDDPVRVFERFATVDALSSGRAEVILGRGSFTESFPLFGYDLRDYEVLFDEKIDLFVKLLDEKPVTWEGTTRAALHDADVFPKTESGRLTTWVGVGGSPESVIRTARYGLRLMLAIIGGAPGRFAPYIELYQRAAEQFGTTAYPVGMHSPGFIAQTDEEAKEPSTPATRRSGTVSAPCAAGRRCAARNSTRKRTRFALHRRPRDRRPQDDPCHPDPRRRPLRPHLLRWRSALRQRQARAVELYGTGSFPLSGRCSPSSPPRRARDDGPR